MAAVDLRRTRGLFVIDMIGVLRNNPALFFVGTFMSLRSTTLKILLLSADNEIQALYQDLFGEKAVTVAREGTLPKDLTKQSYDVVVVEPNGLPAAELGKLFTAVDPARTLLLAGSRTVLKRTASMLQRTTPAKSGSTTSNGAHSSDCLDSYLEHKVGDFVKSMRNGSGRNLHPMLIAAVERPLISLTLRETKGNQIQAAELLGMNRNTLRKKILDLHIPVKRARAN
ncbi:MAG: DNA-binding protein Fis [Nitrospirae bacterium]|nr:DNA-binding protein Fis [Nitrospirota bacterium]